MATANEKTIKLGRQFRSFIIGRESIDVEKRTVPLSFSSETEEVVRWAPGIGDFVEILDHSPQAVDLSRLRKGGALLIDHDPRNQVGKIEEATIGADRKGRAVVRFGRSAKAEEIFRDVVDEIRENVSVGYEPIEMSFERKQENGPDVYRVTRWMPFEISLVSIPADSSVGIGRGEGKDERDVKVIIPEERAAKPGCHNADGQGDMMEPAMKPEECGDGEDCMNDRCSGAKKAPRKTIPQEVRTMERCELCGAEMVGGKCSNPKHDELVAARAKASSVDVKEMEANRKKAIHNLATANKIDHKIEDHWINTGASLEQISTDIINILEERGKTNPQPASTLGLSEKETQQYSIVRAINAMLEKDWTMAPFENETSRAVAQKLGRAPKSDRLLIPFEVLQRQIIPGGRRDLSTTSGGVGGYLVQTDNVGFIEALYNRAVVFKMGARRLSGLQGNVAIPRLSVGASATWLANQASTISEQTQTFVQVPLSPKNVGAYTEISRQLLLQSSPGVEGIVSDDLSRAVASAADYGCLAGAGSSGEPDGIIDYDGVGSVTGTSLAYAGILNFQEDVATSNVTPVRGGYVTTPTVASLCMQRVKFTSTASPLWEGNLWDGQMAGFPAMSSNQVPTGDMIFGDFSEMVVGEWGVLEIEVNPYAGFTAGIVGVRAIYTMDVAFRRPFAFSIAKSIT